MHRISPLSLTALAVALAAAACGGDSPSAPAAPPPARDAAPGTAVRGVTDLGTFGWDHGFGFEIDNAGEIAGRTDQGPPNAPTASHAVFWSERTGAVDLGTLGGATSESRALNEHGMVVGLAQKAGDAPFQRHPTVWYVGADGVETVELGPFVHGQAEDVNNAGVVAGWSTAAVFGPPTAFRWTADGGIQPIPPLGGPRSQAFGIDEAGDVVGSSTVLPPPFVDHAVVWWADGQVTDIGTLGGNTAARSINARGEVVGAGQVCPGCAFHAFYWSHDDGLIDLGTFGGTRSFAFEIDVRGRVAGFYETADQVRHAFIWTKEGGKVDLPTLGGAESSTGSINARGQVTGRAADAVGVEHAVIWQLGPDTPAQ
jgi:probable HAF family extracellular repeat protein